MQSRNTYKDWIPIVIWMGFIYWMSTSTFSASNTSRIIEPILRFLVPTISDAALQTAHAIIRKCAHLTEYMVLGLLLFHALKDTLANASLFRIAVYAVLITLVFAASDEFHQTFVASRTPSPIDVSIDVLGGVIAQCIAFVWYRRRR